jgi:hypothetical protein
LPFGESRRGSASGVFVGMVVVMVVGAGITGVIFYSALGSASSVVGTTSPSNSGPSGAPSNSTLTNSTVTLVGRVAMAGSSLPAADFTVAGVTSTFACSAYPSAAYLALTNNGAGSWSVTSVSISSATAATTFTPSGACEIGASGSGAGTSYIIFPATSKISPNPLPGSYYAGTVSLSDGSQIPFEGIWQ